MSYTKLEFDWISIVALLFAGGVGLIKALTNKPKEQRQWTAKEDNNGTTEEEYFDSELEAQEERYTRPEYTFNPLNEGVGIFSITDDIKEDRSVEQEGHIEFDIRQAVIASEILRRPEF